MRPVFKFVLFLFLLLSISIALWVSFFPVIPFDVFLSQKLQSRGDFIFPMLMKSVSIFGQPLVAIISVLLFPLILFFNSHDREAVFLLFTFPVDGISLLLKDIIHRPRPQNNFVFIKSKAIGSSFPSSHVVHYVVFFGFLFVAMLFAHRLPVWLRMAVAFISLFLILSVSVSRIYLGMHWTTDVLGGYLIGFIFLAIILYFYRKALKNS